MFIVQGRILVLPFTNLRLPSFFDTAFWRVVVMIIMIIMDSKRFVLTKITAAMEWSLRHWNMHSVFSFLWNKFNLHNVQDRADVIGKLSTYYKIMTVREPLERLVSAYRDKLERNSSYYGAISNYIHRTMSKYALKLFRLWWCDDPACSYLVDDTRAAADYQCSTRPILKTVRLTAASSASVIENRSIWSCFPLWL